MAGQKRIEGGLLKGGPYVTGPWPFFGLDTLSYPQQLDMALHQGDQGGWDLMDHLITTLVYREAG